LGCAAWLQIAYREALLAAQRAAELGAGKPTALARRGARLRERDCEARAAAAGQACLLCKAAAPRGSEAAVAGRVQEKEPGNGGRVRACKAGGEGRCTARKGERDLLRAAGPSGPHGGGVHGLWGQLAGEGGE